MPGTAKKKNEKANMYLVNLQVWRTVFDFLTTSLSFEYMFKGLSCKVNLKKDLNSVDYGTFLENYLLSITYIIYVLNLWLIII